MIPSASTTEQAPPFERPSEAVVYWTLERLCGGAGGRYMLPLPKLARACGLSVSTTNRAVLRLASRGLIRYRRGYNQARPSIFEISTDRGAKWPQDTTARLKTSPPPANDSINYDLFLNSIYRYDKGVVPKQDRESSPVPPDPVGQFAYRLAEELGDLKNLALYRSYCQKFPVGVILNAFQRAKATAQSKIKVSRGALFNFLVQLYARKHQDNPNPGD